MGQQQRWTRNYIHWSSIHSYCCLADYDYVLVPGLRRKSSDMTLQRTGAVYTVAAAQLIKIMFQYQDSGEHQVT